MRIPAYLNLSRHHIWYFRWPIPAYLHPQYKHSAIRISLNTRDPQRALRLAKVLEYHGTQVNQRLATLDMSYADAQKALKAFFSKILEDEKQDIDQSGPLPAKRVRELQHTVRSIERYLKEGAETNPEINLDPGDDMADAVIQLVQADIPGLNLARGTEGHARLKQDLKLPFLSYAKELLLYNSRVQDYDLSSPAPSLSPPIQIAKHSKPLKEAVDDFIAERMRGKEWTERTKADRAAQFALLTELLGDKYDIALIDAKTATDVKKVLQEIPKGRNKNPLTRGLTLQEAIKVKTDKLDTRTVNEYLLAYQSLFGWLETHGLISRNPFKGLSIRQKQTKQKKRYPFTDEQMKAILKALPEHTPEKSGKSYRYWGTMIAIYTGARLNEVAQLALDDIKQEDGIWYFDLNDEEEKQLKNVSSKRKVPIHAELINKGLLTHVSKMKEEGHKRLFPDLKFMKGHGYGRYLARWVNDQFLVSHGLKTGTLSFHSFRHTFITRILNIGISTGIVQELVGHSKDVVTEAVYNKGYNLNVLKAAIDQLSYS